MSSFSIAEAEDFVQKLEQLSENPPSVILENEQLRRRFREATNAANLAVSWPTDIVHQIGHGSLISSLGRVGVDTKIFETLAANATPLSSEEVAEKTGVDPVLAKRLLRFYESYRWVKIANGTQYVANNVTKALAPPLGFGLQYYDTVLNPPFQSLPEYFKKHGYKNPTSAIDSPWQSGYSTEEHAFVWLVSHPEHFKLWLSWIPHEREGFPEFVDVFPFEQEVGKNATEDAALFVDIGCGFGTQSALIRDRFPHLKGKIVMQDQQHAIDALSAEIRSGIDAQVYDFYTPQPVQGARAYYMRMIIHDHDDSNAQKILKSTISAFDKDSVLLIDDMVLPDTGSTPYRATIYDMTMMSTLAAKERTEKEWYELLESVGMKIIKIWKYAEETGDSIIVAKPAAFV